MLEFRTNLTQIITPLLHEAIELQLDRFIEKHPHTAKENGLDSEAFPRVVAAKAATHFAKHVGAQRWRGVLNQSGARQIAVEVTRTTRRSYTARVQLTTIHTEILQTLR